MTTLLLYNAIATYIGNYAVVTSTNANLYLCSTLDSISWIIVQVAMILEWIAYYHNVPHI